MLDTAFGVGINQVAGQRRTMHRGSRETDKGPGYVAAPEWGPVLCWARQRVPWGQHRMRFQPEEGVLSWKQIGGKS